MDDVMKLLTSFEGRIGRKTYWLGMLGILAAFIFLSMALMPMIGFGMLDMERAMSGGGNVDQQAIRDAMARNSMAMGWVSVVIFLALLLPMAALTIKRRHDRGSEGKLFWVYAGLNILYMVLQGSGMGYNMVEVEGTIVPMPTPLTSSLMLAAGAMGIYFLVVCGFLKGDEGPNAYGPDPLENS